MIFIALTFNTVVEVTLSVFINASGHNTAGETFVLECSTDVTGSTDQPLFTWLDDEVEITSFDHRRMVSTSMNPVGTGGNYSWTSTLTLNPLRASDTGTFMCRVMVGGTVKNASIDISVNGKA